MKKIALTDYQAFCLTQCINAWNQKNKASKEPYLNLEFFKKLYGIISALKVTLEAVEATGINILDLYKNKETTEYNLATLDKEEFNRMVDGTDTYEVFEWIKEG